MKPNKVMPIPTIPSQAIAELQQGRKIEAIRIVRAAQSLGLKEAKEMVEAYVETQPALKLALEAKNKEAKATLVRWLAVVAAMIAVAYVLAGLK
jgi:ribosomal protein L7/L12